MGGRTSHTIDRLPTGKSCEGAIGPSVNVKLVHLHNLGKIFSSNPRRSDDRDQAGAGMPPWSVHGPRGTWFIRPLRSLTH